MRDRYRAQVRQEIKHAALRQLAAAGAAGLSVSAIGKELGVSGPALYRYYASRDDLLTELVIDAYDDLARALRGAAGPEAGLEPRARLDVLARAYRAWALAEPHRYRLLYGPPLPGYDAHAERLVTAAEAAMDLLVEVIGEVDKPGGAYGGPPPAGSPLAGQLTAWAATYRPGTDPATALRAVLAWSRLHGFVSLEIAGNYASMGIDPDPVFEIQLAGLIAL